MIKELHKIMKSVPLLGRILAVYALSVAVISTILIQTTEELGLAILLTAVNAPASGITLLGSYTNLPLLIAISIALNLVFFIIFYRASIWFRKEASQSKSASWKVLGRILRWSTYYFGVMGAILVAPAGVVGLLFLLLYISETDAVWKDFYKKHVIFFFAIALLAAPLVILFSAV